MRHAQSRLMSTTAASYFVWLFQQNAMVDSYCCGYWRRSDTSASSRTPQSPPYMHPFWSYVLRGFFASWRMAPQRARKTWLTAAVGYLSYHTLYLVICYNRQTLIVDLSDSEQNSFYVRQKTSTQRTKHQTVTYQNKETSNRCVPKETNIEPLPKQTSSYVRTSNKRRSWHKQETKEQKNKKTRELRTSLQQQTAALWAQQETPRTSSLSKAWNRVVTINLERPWA